MDIQIDAPEEPLTYIEASCHCELNTFSVALESSSLPISSSFCHCNTCRHSTGQLAAEYAPIVGQPLSSTRPGRNQTRSINGNSPGRSSSRSPNKTPDSIRSRSPSPFGRAHIKINAERIIETNGGLLAPPQIRVRDAHTEFDLGDLTPYKSSPTVTRYFCKSCSAQLFWRQHTPSSDSWCVAVGALTEIDGIVTFGSHIWVGDTLDGGFANDLRVVEGVKLPRYKEDEHSEQLPVGWKDPASQAVDSGEVLPISCHCKTISYSISRPSTASALLSSPYPDLLCPYDVGRRAKIRNPTDEKWWLRPVPPTATGGSEDVIKPDHIPTRYLAGYCMCDFCRLTSGFEVQAWAYLPLANIVDSRTGEEIILDDPVSRPNGLQQYIPSTGNYREFCATCGAMVFWWQAGVPDLVDVSVGLVDEKAAGGAKAESWFDWCKDRVSFAEQALNQTLVKGLADGLKSQ